MFFYGNASKTSLNKIKTILNSNIHFALGAHRTTPINNIIFESNITNLEDLYQLESRKLIKSIITCQYTPIRKFVENYAKSKRTPRYLSTLQKSVKLTLEYELPTKILRHNISFTPWLLDSNCFDLHIFI